MKENSHLPTLRILHLDDDPFELDKVEDALKRNSIACHFDVESSSTVNDYRRKLKQDSHDIAILDIHIRDQAFPEVDGMAIAQETRKSNPGIVILMRSSMDDAETVAKSLSCGSDDFLSKHSDRGELSLRIFNSHRLALLKRGTPYQDPADRSHLSALMDKQIAGRTLKNLAARIPKIVSSAVSAVHVYGESGTGKEVVAQIFETLSKPDHPFVKINCGAISPTLLESELFGHVKGSFTGAVGDKKGFIENASGGWIFLDELAALTLSAQAALLRVIENQEVIRVGSTQPVPIQIRVISATNEHLSDLVASGKFRKDLWQRLRETEIVLPPLRERPEEIEELIRFFCATMPGGPYSCTEPTLDVLKTFSWSDGNVRELRNCLRAMTEYHVNGLLTPLSIPERIWEELGERKSSTAEASLLPTQDASESSFGFKVDLKTPLSFDKLSDQLLLEIIRNLGGIYGRFSLRGLAKAIGISRSTLSGRLKAMVHEQLVPFAELSTLVSITEEGE